MKTKSYSLIDSLNIAGSIAGKDILEMLKNRATLTNLIFILVLVFFFHWMLSIRTFDKTLDVVVYDQGSNLLLESEEFADGSDIRILYEETFEDMQNRLGFQDLGVVLTSQSTDTGDPLTLEGYVFWEKRAEVADLETEYSAIFSQYLDRPVQINIGDNIIVPNPDQSGNASTAAFHMFFAMFYMGIVIMPWMMFEERVTKTMDALLVSPASHAQIVLGKGLAGCFYIFIAAILTLYFNSIYVTNWFMIAIGFLCAIVFSVLMGLVLGTLIKSRQQVQLVTLPVIFLLLVPTFFVQEPNLAPGVRSIISILPTSAITRLISLGTTNSTPINLLTVNLGIAIVGILLLFGIIVWQLRRSDR